MIPKETRVFLVLYKNKLLASLLKQNKKLNSCPVADQDLFVNYRVAIYNGKMTHHMYYSYRG